MGAMLVSCVQTTSPRALRAGLWADLYDCVYCVHVPLHPLPRHLHASRARLRGDSLMATTHRQRARVCVSVAGHATPYRRDDAGNGDLLPPAPPRRPPRVVIGRVSRAERVSACLFRQYAAAAAAGSNTTSRKISVTAIQRGGAISIQQAAAAHFSPLIEQQASEDTPLGQCNCSRHPGTMWACQLVRQAGSSASRQGPAGVAVKTTGNWHFTRNDSSSSMPAWVWH